MQSTAPVYAAHVSLESDFSENGFRRILDDPREFRFRHESLSYLDLAMRHWNEILTDEQKVRINRNPDGTWCNRDPQAFQLAVRIISFWRENKAS